MWSATCDYVKKLYPPSQYAGRMQKLYDKYLMNETLAENFTCYRPTNHEENHLGVGRYAMERWVWSNPNVKPCSVLPYRIPKMPYTLEDQNTWEPALAPPPHRIGSQGNSYARLDGRLLEWSFVYPGQQIPIDSWIWRCYSGKEQGSPEWMAQCQNRSIADAPV